MKFRSPRLSILVAALDDLPDPDVDILAVPPVCACAALPQPRSPEQRLSVEKALRAYTSDAAYLSFEEGSKGTLEPDKLGDVTVLSADPARVPPEAIRDIAVEMTVIGGEIVYERSSAGAPD